MELIRRNAGWWMRTRQTLCLREVGRRLRGASVKAAARLRSVADADSGQGVAEYVIILAVIVVAAIILAIAFHDKLAAVWQSVTDQLGDLA